MDSDHAGAPLSRFKTNERSCSKTVKYVITFYSDLRKK